VSCFRPTIEECDDVARPAEPGHRGDRGRRTLPGSTRHRPFLGTAARRQGRPHPVHRRRARRAGGAGGSPASSGLRPGRWPHRRPGSVRSGTLRTHRRRSRPHRSPAPALPRGRVAGPGTQWPRRRHRRRGGRCLRRGCAERVPHRQPGRPMGSHRRWPRPAGQPADRDRDPGRLSAPADRVPAGPDRSGDEHHHHLLHLAGGRPRRRPVAAGGRMRHGRCRRGVADRPAGTRLSVRARGHLLRGRPGPALLRRGHRHRLHPGGRRGSAAPARRRARRRRPDSGRPARQRGQQRRRRQGRLHRTLAAGTGTRHRGGTRGRRRRPGAAIPSKSRPCAEPSDTTAHRPRPGADSAR
jgi:hypothetical protein